MSPQRAKRSKADQQVGLSDLETRLARVLQPVRPPADLAQRLRERISLPPRRLMTRRLVSWKPFFLVVGGTLSGLALILTVARALYYLFWRHLHADQRA